MSDKIILIGTGLTGMVQALALAQSGFEVTLIGPEPSLQKDERSTAILLPGIGFLKTLGIWQQIEPFSTALTTMELIDGNKHSVFDAHEIDQINFGYNISNAALKKTLVAALKKSKAVTWHPQQAVAFNGTGQGWDVTLANHKIISGDLLIGADGRHSPVRSAATIAIEEKNIDQVAMVGIVQAEKPHFNVTVEWYRQGGPLTLVPVDKNLFAFVWCDTAQAHTQRQKMSPEKELSDLAQQRFGALKIKNKTQFWPIKPFLSKKLVGENCVLIGEAAHALPPIGAQGFNASLQDIMALTTILEQGRAIGYRLNDAILLSGYEKIRMPELHLRAKAINALNTTLLSQSRLPHRLRRFSLNGLQYSAFLKKQIMQIGLAPIRSF